MLGLDDRAVEDVARAVVRNLGVAGGGGDGDVVETPLAGAGAVGPDVVGVRLEHDDDLVELRKVDLELVAEREPTVGVERRVGQGQRVEVAERHRRGGGGAVVEVVVDLVPGQRLAVGHAEDGHAGPLVVVADVEVQVDARGPGLDGGEVGDVDAVDRLVSPRPRVDVPAGVATLIGDGFAVPDASGVGADGVGVRVVGRGREVTVYEVLARDERLDDLHVDGAEGDHPAAVGDRVGEGVGADEAGLGRVDERVAAPRDGAVLALVEVDEVDWVAVGVAVVGQDVDGAGGVAVDLKGVAAGDGLLVDRRR